MAGKHYGGPTRFSETAPKALGFQPRLHNAFAVGYSGETDVFTAGTPEKAAYDEGVFWAGVAPPGPAGRRWEVAKSPT